LLGLLGFVAFQRYGVLSKLVHTLRHLRLGQERVQRLNRHLLALDAQLMTYYTKYPWRFARSLLWHFVAYTCDIVKTYILFRLLLGAAAPTLAEASLVAIGVNAIEQMFFFVPGQIGTLEGARLVVLAALGVSQIYGLAFGIVARLEQLFWNGLGLLAYALCTRLFPHAPARHAAPVSAP
jgi:uncharacterized membrane protein YbhN (UPF0104 family)